jgi:hypothetical protein
MDGVKTNRALMKSCGAGAQQPVSRGGLSVGRERIAVARLTRHKMVWPSAAISVRSVALWRITYVHFYPQQRIAMLHHAFVENGRLSRCDVRFTRNKFALCCWVNRGTLDPRWTRKNLAVATGFRSESGLACRGYGFSPQKSKAK